MSTTRSALALLVISSAMLIAGCTSNIRLDAPFDSDPLGSPPPFAPTPTPPNDQLNWRTGYVVATVVNRSSGDNWVRLQPLRESLTAPDFRRVYLLAVTDPFTTSPPANIRGHVRLRLDDLGTLGIGFRPLQNERTLDYIGGFELSNFVPPAGGGVYGLKEFRGDLLTDPFGLPSSGQVAPYVAGQVIDVNWTIDQSSRTFTVSIVGGASQSSSYSGMSGGVPTVPLQKLILECWIHKPTSRTTGFIDNLRAEEYR